MPRAREARHENEEARDTDRSDHRCHHRRGRLLHDRRTPASADPQPTLGRAWNPNTKGYGAVAPANVNNGGDPTGDIWDITWSSWGGEQAIGTGTSYAIPPGAISVAQSVKQPATIVAYNLGNCDGQLMYQAAKWYFPGYGESFNPAGHYNICTGDYVDGI